MAESAAGEGRAANYRTTALTHRGRRPTTCLRRYFEHTRLVRGADHGVAPTSAPPRPALADEPLRYRQARWCSVTVDKLRGGWGVHIATIIVGLVLVATYAARGNALVAALWGAFAAMGLIRIIRKRRAGPG